MQALPTFVPIWRQLCLTISVAFVGIMILAGFAILASYEARGERMELRSPSPPNSTDEASFMWAGMNAFCNSRPVDVHRVRSLTASAPLPPGVAHWPDFDESFVSPEIASRGCADQFGLQVGQIDASSLSDPGELVVYWNPAQNIEIDDRFESMTDWGGDGPVPLGSPMYDQPQGRFFSLWALMGFLPSCVLLIAAIDLFRQDVSKRDRVFMALGMAWRVRFESRVRPMIIPIALGACTSALATFIVAKQAILSIPLSEFKLTGTDLQKYLIIIYVTQALLLVVTCAVGGIITSRRWQPNLEHSNSFERARRVFTAIAFALWAIIALMGVWPRQLATTFGPDLYSTILLSLIVCAALSSPIVVGALTSSMTRVNSHFIRIFDSPLFLTGAGLLRYSARDIRAFGSISGSLLIFVTLASSLYVGFISPAADTVEFFNHYENKVATVERLPLTEEGTSRFEGVLDSQGVDFVIVAAKRPDEGFAVFDPKDHAELSASFSEEVQRCAYSGPMPELAELLSSYWWIEEEDCNIETTSPEIWTHAIRGNAIYVVTARIGLINADEIQEALSSQFAVPPLIEYPNATYFVGDAVNEDQGRWLLLGAVILAFFGLSAAWLFATSNISDCANKVRRFGALGATRRFVWGTLLIRFATPALVGLLWGALGSTTIIWLFSRMTAGTSSQIAIEVLVATSASFIAVTCLAWIVVSAATSRQVFAYPRYQPEMENTDERSVET